MSFFSRRGNAGPLAPSAPVRSGQVRSTPAATAEGPVGAARRRVAETAALKAMPGWYTNPETGAVHGGDHHYFDPLGRAQRARSAVAQPGACAWVALCRSFGPVYAGAGRRRHATDRFWPLDHRMEARPRGRSTALGQRLARGVREVS